MCLQIIYQLRKVLKAGLEPVPQANGAVRFFCDPTFWAKNVVNLGERIYYSTCREVCREICFWPPTVQYKALHRTGDMPLPAH